MLVDRDAAPVVGDGEAVPLVERHLDAVGVPGDGFVHRIVEHFGGEVVECALVGPADVHARTAAHRFEPFEHLDRGTIVAFAIAGRQGVEQVVSGFGGHVRPIGCCDSGEQAVVAPYPQYQCRIVFAENRFPLFRSML